VYSWVWPFNRLASPLLSLYYAFDNLVLYFNYFYDWVAEANTKISQILSISAISSYFSAFLTAAYNAWNWVIDAWNNITNIINIWWNSTQSIVFIWIDQAKQWALAQINSLANALTEVQTWWNNFKSSIPSLNEILLWFTNWWANILAHIQSWWVERLSDIESLLISLALDLSPFWEGWQEIRETVFNFFNDPLEWLWARFTDWFLGAE